ncbi:OsmC/Ohr family domain-containing protein [Synechococcus sp. A18-25c]|uniref:OsmC family protein n=1 Tax=Synechococcus sp. A18-25c TaxID=1866938 RepID=UPI001647A8B4|nr:OsmC family protein [Synechococcus sp. A18-25c]QNJ20373.1 OsmC/Ohr family domain-containing protein [Synechococcus sp. A18-25c]
MATVSCRYTGNLHCEAIHTASGAQLSTDAPVDNQGLGEQFSPTDLLATALATCILTIMGITAKSRGWSIEGSRAEVEKRMTQDGPRRVESLTVHLTLPSELNSEQRLLLQRVAAQCPVKRSLDPQIEINLNWN